MSSLCICHTVSYAVFRCSLWILVPGKPVGPTIEGQLFISPDLAKQWAQLDQFEGASYKRRMIAVVTDTGTVVANVYLDAQY